MCSLSASPLPKAQSEAIVEQDHRRGCRLGDNGAMNPHRRAGHRDGLLSKVKDKVSQGRRA
jgi:hypothetical protein